MQIIVALRVNAIPSIQQKKKKKKNAIPSKKTLQKERHKQGRGHPLSVRLKN